MTTPDIQQLLRRHLYGTKAERDRIEEAMAGVKVTEELAREAASESVEHATAGNATAAKDAEARALEWLRRQNEYRRCLT